MWLIAVAQTQDANVNNRTGGPVATSYVWPGEHADDAIRHLAAYCRAWSRRSSVPGVRQARMQINAIASVTHLPRPPVDVGLLTGMGVTVLDPEGMGITKEDYA